MKPEECQGMDIFSGMDYDQVAAVLAYSSEDAFGSGKVIFKQGDDNDGKFYLVVEGKIEIWKQTRKEEEHVVTLGAGAVFGEMGVFDDKPRAATIKTAEAVRCLALSRAKYQELKQANPAVALVFVENILLATFDRFRAVSSKAETASFWL